MVRSANSQRLLALKLALKLAHKRQAGAGMIEVMVAIIIAAFALLGLAGLQVSALRYQKTANYHSQASQFAAEIADRMRANTAGAIQGMYSVPPGDYTDGNPVLQTPAACANPAACARAQAAVQDIYAWRQNLHNNMSGGWGSVTGNTVSGFTVRVYFKEGTVDKASPTAPPPATCKEAKNTDYNVKCFTTVFFP